VDVFLNVLEVSLAVFPLLGVRNCSIDVLPTNRNGLSGVQLIKDAVAGQ